MLHKTSSVDFMADIKWVMSWS